MILRHLRGRAWIGWGIVAALACGCAAPGGGQPPTHADTILADMTADIEALYLSWHELDQTRKEIRFLARGYLFDPDDRQLAYMQKISLYIQDASVRIHHRWEQLSVVHYIRPEMVRDYLTLAAGGLTTTIGEIEDDRRFIEIYAHFVQCDAVKAEIVRAQRQIDDAHAKLTRLFERLSPYIIDRWPAFE